MDWAAFVDESQSDQSRDPDIYILSATLVTPGELEGVREEMLKLRFGSRGKVHWHDENSRRKARITTTVSGLRVEHLVVVRTCASTERNERRRRLCMEHLCRELDQMGVNRMTVESRGAADDHRDLNALQSFRARRLVGNDLRMFHVPGPAEPILWVPDAVCGAVVASRTGTRVYLDTLRASCTIHQV